ncbi:unnamed protein product [Euphydryas editha]|uniref:Uncharacterized protein n=1 Tax=Euphydryas editha TaxID=104508 RepID=A0AAU9V6Y8_EUPED|nr:unnamed protein product [Euphydryas editha]
MYFRKNSSLRDTEIKADYVRISIDDYSKSRYNGINYKLVKTGCHYKPNQKPFQRGQDLNCIEIARETIDKTGGARSQYTGERFLGARGVFRGAINTARKAESRSASLAAARATERGRPGAAPAAARPATARARPPCL